MPLLLITSAAGANGDGYGALLAFDGGGKSRAREFRGTATFRSLNTTVTSGPNDIWITPDGAHLYQIYPNASKLVGYATQPGGSLKEVTNIKIPYNSPQGLVGI
jgi:hypothetical protein